MIKQKAVVKQLENEPQQDYVKFLVFAELGVNRSLDQSFKAYYETNKEVSQSWHTLFEKYHWAERAAEHDKAQVTPAPATKSGAAKR